MKKNKLLLFVLSVIFTLGICCQAMAQSSALWLGTKSLPANFFVEVSKGNVPGHTIIHKFGHGTVGTAMAPLTVSGEYQTPTAAVLLEFVSADADDTAAGVGAREITIVGIDANYDEIIQVIATNGLTAVPIPTALLRLYRWYVSASGVYATSAAGSHEGILTIRDVSDTPIWSQIEFAPFPAGQSEIGAYTVPDGFRAYIVQQDIDVDSTKTVDVIIFKRSGIDTVAAPFTAMTTVSHYVGLANNNPTDFKIPLDSFPARTDIGYMGEVSSGTADISVHFGIMLVEDGY